jgi:hypothetical protein
MITIFILSFISFWVLGLKTGTHRVFPNDLFLAADDARVIYESRNILGYAETVAITSVGIFLPLLIILWNISRESVSGSLEKLIALRGATHSSRNGLGFEDRLEAAISLAYADLTYLRQTAKELSTVFWKIVWAIVLFFIGLSCANFLPGQPLTVYIVVVVLKGLSMVITLWLFGFLLMYVVVVQPIVRETRYEAVYELEKQYLK